MSENQTTPPPGEGRRNSWTERIDVTVDQLAARVQDLISQGNVRSLKIRHEGRTLVDIPLTAAVLGGVAGLMFAPYLAVLVAIAGAVAHVELIVEHEGEPPAGHPTIRSEPPSEGPGEGI